MWWIAASVMWFARCAGDTGPTGLGARNARSASGLQRSGHSSLPPSASRRPRSASRAVDLTNLPQVTAALPRQQSSGSLPRQRHAPIKEANNYSNCQQQQGAPRTGSANGKRRRPRNPPGAHAEGAEGGGATGLPPPRRKLRASDPRLGWRVLRQSGGWALCESTVSGQFYFHEGQQLIQADKPSDYRDMAEDDGSSPELTSGLLNKSYSPDDDDAQSNPEMVFAGGDGDSDEPCFLRIVLDDRDMAALMARDIRKACQEDPSLFPTVQARFSVAGAEQALLLSELPEELSFDANQLGEAQLSECLPTEDGRFWILWRCAAQR